MASERIARPHVGGGWWPLPFAVCSGLVPWQGLREAAEPGRKWPPRSSGCLPRSHAHGQVLGVQSVHDRLGEALPGKELQVATRS